MKAADLVKFTEPPHPEDVYWRIGNRNKEKTSGLALAYVDARSLMKVLDRIAGPDGWQDHYEVHQVHRKHTNNKGEVVEVDTTVWVCTLSIKVDGEWVSKSDAAESTDFEAAKGGCSDAFKRAGVKWGYPRALYELESPWVKLIKNGYEIDPKERPRLQRLVSELSGGRKTRPAPDLNVPSTGITKEDRDSLVEANMQVLLAYGYSEPEIQGMTPSAKFLPLSFALRAIGKEKMADVLPEDVQAIKDAMQGWSPVQKEE